MKYCPRVLFALILLLVTQAMLAQQTKFTLTIDVEKQTVDPADPVVHSYGDDFLGIRILKNGTSPAESDTQLRFFYPVYEVTSTVSAGRATVSVQRNVTGAGVADDFVPGTQHSIAFRPCSEREFKRLELVGAAGAPISTDRCPLIVKRGRAIIVLANTDVIPVEAIVDVHTNPALAPFDPANVRRFLVNIRTVRPYWNLNWSAGLTFFPGVRDEQYELSAIPDDGTTKDVDESKFQRLTRVNDGEIPYELAAFGTYMLSRPRRTPLGLTFGVSTKVPATEFSGMLGVSVRIKPFPITDSAYITTGISYTGRSRLRAEYRGDSTVAVGLTNANIMQTERDLGYFLAFSFGFGGGQTEFTKVVSGK